LIELTGRYREGNWISRCPLPGRGRWNICRNSYHSNEPKLVQTSDIVWDCCPETARRNPFRRNA